MTAYIKNLLDESGVINVNNITYKENNHWHGPCESKESIFGYHVWKKGNRSDYLTCKNSGCDKTFYPKINKVFL